MMRKGFLLNSFVLLLLIPMLLLLATYEDISSQIIQAQSERVQAERTYRVISCLEMDFQKALEISTKRALIATTEYVATTDFIRGEMANETIANLILDGYSRVGISNEQNLKAWLENITSSLREQGYYVSPSINEILNNISITVAPLDSFRIAVTARIPRIRITDSSGIVIYEGALPQNRNATIIISLEGIEDAFIARETDDFYHRIIRACKYPYPELVKKPIKVLNGTGESDIPIMTGVYGEDISYNATHIWKDSSYITNTTIGGIEVSPIDVLENGDVGVLVFDLQQVGQTSWCSQLPYRLNITINSPQPLTEYQLEINLTSVFSSLSNPPQMEIYYQDCTGPLKYWIEEWSPNSTILWIRVNLTAGDNIVSLYYDPSVVGNKGNPNDVFDLYEDFEDGNLNGWSFSGNGGWIITTDSYEGRYAATNENINPNEEACIYKNLNLPGESQISFWWRLESDGGGIFTKDQLEFLLDGIREKVIEGTDYANWSRETVIIPSGQHRIEWCYHEAGYWFFGWHNDKGNGYLDYIIVRRYSSTNPTYSFSTLEEKPSSLLFSPARAYDIQPFVSCLENGYYFGIYNAPSFFERLEGSMSNHEAYEKLANETQDMLGISYNGKHHPIGLVSFVLPTKDTRLSMLINGTGVELDKQTCFDYYFLKYYFENDNTAKKEGFKVYGISAGDVIIDENFFLDNQTAVAIFGTQGARDLLQR